MLARTKDTPAPGSQARPPATRVSCFVPEGANAMMSAGAAGGRASDQQRATIHSSPQSAGRMVAGCHIPTSMPSARGVRNWRCVTARREDRSKISALEPERVDDLVGPRDDVWAPRNGSLSGPLLWEVPPQPGSGSARVIQSRHLTGRCARAIWSQGISTRKE
jgi:hypothetical protein